MRVCAKPLKTTIPIMSDINFAKLFKDLAVRYLLKFTFSSMKLLQVLLYTC